MAPTTEIMAKEEEIDTVDRNNNDTASVGFCSSTSSIIILIQKLVAEVIGTYLIIFTGCGSVVVNKIYGSVTFPGICITWGLIVMVMIHTLGHISGAHFNSAVTIALAAFGRFPMREVPFYIVAEVMGSILASGTLALIFDITPNAYFGTIPVGSNGQSLGLEIIISFLLMFACFGAGDTGEGRLAPVIVGMTVTLSVFVAGPISGASMNPARSIGPAVIKHQYKGLWVYVVGPIVGTLLGGLVYSLLKLSATDESYIKLSKTKLFKKITSKSTQIPH